MNNADVLVCDSHIVCVYFAVHHKIVWASNVLRMDVKVDMPAMLKMFMASHSMHFLLTQSCVISGFVQNCERILS